MTKCKGWCPPPQKGSGLGPCTPPPLDVQVTLENYRWTSRLQIRVDVHPLTKIRADVHLRRILMPKYHFSMSMLQVSGAGYPSPESRSGQFFKSPPKSRIDFLGFGPSPGIRVSVRVSKREATSLKHKRVIRSPWKHLETNMEVKTSWFSSKFFHFRFTLRSSYLLYFLIDFDAIFTVR